MVWSIFGTNTAPVPDKTLIRYEGEGLGSSYQPSKENEAKNLAVQDQTFHFGSQ
jgi:hypothetical protein